MVPKAKEIFFSRTEYKIKDLKVINQDMCKKGYYIYSLYDQILTFCGKTPHPL